ncbi:hypothetical protein [Clostridium sp. D33t1_170424_F3]|uniref:hypothetical protein n=1 Tax=Clostridium sp. D33t1_170424_F3 TaxID=2787099 RepID=UPI0018AC4861|nr:hypothetical protein [Clostridium sp. D33t1_170424_F3]
MISKGVEEFLDYIREAEQLYRISVANEQEASDATQDILHSIELEEHDYHGSARLARKLKEVRQARRAAKDLMAQALPVVEWAEANRQTIKALERLLGEVRKAEKNTENRIYTPKTTALDGKWRGNAG